MRRDQKLASSSIRVTSAVLAREHLEEMFVRFVANRGRDRWGVFEDRIASQPQHFRWTLALDFVPSHDEAGRPLMVASTRHENAHWIPFPDERLPMWNVIDRWGEQARRMRSLIAAIQDADPDAHIEIVPEMFY